MKKAFILTAAVFTATASLAIAGEGHGGRHERLKAADTDGNGMINRAEAAALPRLAKHFDTIDANTDGNITQDEMRAHRQKQLGELWKKLDRDGNGAISKAEAAGRPRLEKHFDQLDANHDGQVSQDEMKAAHEMRGHGKKH